VRIPSFALPTAFAAVAFAAVLWVTRPPGPGLDPDAMAYLGAAESFASHGTLRVPSADWDEPAGSSPLGHFPPGFSLVLAAPIAAGVAPVEAARGIEALAAAVAIGLSVWLVAGVAGAAGGALAGAMLLVTPGLVLDHLRVLSEPLFLLLLTASLVVMLRRPDRPIAYGVVAALAGLVRYAGVSVGATAALWAVSRPGTLRLRMGRAALAAAPTLLVQVAWTLRTRAQSGTVRTLGINGDLGATLREGLGTVQDWLAPNLGPTGIRAVSALLLAGLAALLVWGGVRRDRRPFALLGAAAVCYAGLVLVSRLVADPWIPLDERLLSPFFLVAALGVAAAAGLGWRDARPALRWAGALVLAAWLGASAWRSAAWVRDARDGGWGYAGVDWQASPLVRWLRTEGARRPVFSNSPPDVWFANGRNSWKLPGALDAAEVAAFGAALRERGGAVVGFANENEPMADPAALAGALGLPVLARFDGATVWGPPPR
jgi:hypothetical protein